MAWLTGWDYRKRIAVSRASGAVSNYPILINVGESSGATGEDVDCGGNVLSTFNDLRFTNSTGTSLDYFIERITGTTPNQLASVWVEVDSIGTGDTVIYMYYGNAVAAAASNITNTFGVGKADDFEWGSHLDHIETAGGNITWTAPSGHTYISTDDKVQGTRCLQGRISIAGAAQCALTAPHSGTATYAIRFYFHRDDASVDNLTYHGNGSYYIGIGGLADETVAYYTTSWQTLGTYAAGQWHLIEIYNMDFTANTFSIKINTDVYTGKAMVSSALFNDVWQFAHGNVAGDTEIDPFIIRQWVSPEPVISSYGPAVASTKVNTVIGPSKVSSSVFPTRVYGVYI